MTSPTTDREAGSGSSANALLRNGPAGKSRKRLVASTQATLLKTVNARGEIAAPRHRDNRAHANQDFGNPRGWIHTQDAAHQIPLVVERYVVQARLLLQTQCSNPNLAVAPLDAMLRIGWPASVRCRIPRDPDVRSPTPAARLCGRGRC